MVRIDFIKFAFLVGLIAICANFGFAQNEPDLTQYYEYDDTNSAVKGCSSESECRTKCPNHDTVCWPNGRGGRSCFCKKETSEPAEPEMELPPGVE